METDADLISVIIPVWNGATFLAEAINSVKRQCYEKLEILVVDDGSTDETEQIARKFANDIRYIRQPHKGVAAARNRGLEEALGGIIAFLDADDLWPPFKLDLQLDVLRDETLEMVLGSTRFEKTVENAKGPLAKGDLESMFFYHLSSGLYRRSVFDRIGRFDERLDFSEDVDWFMRAREAGVKTMVLRQETTIWREHGGNISVGKSLKDLKLLKIFKKSLKRRALGRIKPPPLPPLGSKSTNGLHEGPLVSVVVPVRNGGRFLRATLTSVLDQTYRPLELIIIDDGSDDESGDVSCSFPEASYYRQAKRGDAEARNAGIDAAHGRFIAFLDADDLWMPNKLSLQVAFHIKNPNVGYSLTGEKIFLEPGVQQPAWLKTEILMNPHPGFVPGTLMVKKEVFVRVGRFDSRYEIASDADWLLRVKDTGITAGILPETLLLKRIHGDNLTHRQATMRDELMRSFKASADRRKATSELAVPRAQTEYPS